ncbi:MAG: riboflavin synthase [Armatimonadota bacterium]
MFTGLIEETGTITGVRPTATGRDLTVRAPGIVQGAAIGDSVAVNGICLTVVTWTGDSFTCHAGSETLARTTAGGWQPGQRANLEQALQVGARLGGHFVQGHVDGVGQCLARRQVGETWEFTFSLLSALAVYVVEKGSITVDGISLTVAALTAGSFSVAIIPHTIAHTTLGDLQPGRPVNLEVDILAKYVRRSLGLESQGLTADYLREQGF